MKNRKIFICIIAIILIAATATVCFSACSLISPKGTTDLSPYFVNKDQMNDISNANVVANNIVSSVVKFSSITGSTTAIGSGFVINEKGYIITNAHCILEEGSITVNRSSKFTAEFYNGTSINLKVVDFDSKLDIALLKPSDSSYSTTNFLTFEKSASVKYGQQAYTFGCPENIGLLFSEAMVSSPSIKVDDTQYNRIALDSTINHGNSGGALVNQYSRVIGVVFARIENVKDNVNQTYGIGCAVKSDDTMQFLDNVKLIDSDATYSVYTAA